MANKVHKKQKKQTQAKRKQMIEEIFKKGRKQREIAKKFDEKIASKQGSGGKKNKFQQLKTARKSESNSIRDHVSELNKKLDNIRAERKL